MRGCGRGWYACGHVGRGAPAGTRRGAGAAVVARMVGTALDVCHGLSIGGKPGKSGAKRFSTAQKPREPSESINRPATRTRRRGAGVARGRLVVVKCAGGWLVWS